MNTEKQCLHCEGKTLIKAHAVDRGEKNRRRPLCVETYEDPTAFIFKGTLEAEMQAHVCESCGFVMFFVKKDELLELKKGTV